VYKATKKVEEHWVS